MASHYRFAPLFCLPARGQEKSDVERTVFALQRRFATPVPAVEDMDALNRHLLSCCLRERRRVVRGRSETIGRMFAHERRDAIELPAHPFDCGMRVLRQADKYQTVLFEDVRYSVPRQAAFQPITVRAYLDQVVLVHQERVVARHPRSRTPGAQVLDPKHFLATLERKPAYLDHTKLFKELSLPPVFAALRDRLNEQFGARTGARHYIRVLQLLAGHRVQVVADAIEACMTRANVRADLIERRLAGTDAAATPAILDRVHVPPPDLRRFDLLLRPHLAQGEDRHERHVAQAQPQEPAAADDAGPVRQALA